MFLCFYLQVKLLACLCVRSEIDQIIRYVPLIYAFQIPEDIDQSPFSVLYDVPGVQNSHIVVPYDIMVYLSIAKYNHSRQGIVDYR